MASTIKLKNGSGAPLASDLVQGEPALDLTNKRLYTEDSGGTVIEVGTNPTEITTGDLTATGTTTLAGATTSADINFGDNDKAIFGAGDDLQIYHDGSNSIIKDNGTGNLLIQGATDIVLEDTSGANYFRGVSGSYVRLYHNNSTKLETQSTGIDVTGTVTADGLTVAVGDEIDFAGGLGEYASSPALGIVGFTSRGSVEMFTDSNNNGASTGTAFAIYDGAEYGGSTKNLLTVTKGNDISFYEDTGTTAKFFWDASAESLGIGTASPETALHVKASAGDILTLESDNFTQVPNIVFKNADGKKASIAVTDTEEIIFRVTSDDTNAMIIASNGDISFYEDTGTTAKFFWDASLESLGIGTTTLTPTDGANIELSSATSSRVILDSTGVGGRKYTMATGTNGSLDFYDYDASAYRMRIDSSGNLDMTAGGGDIIMANGAGIDFSASEGAGATSSVLDDYEEGTWTPALERLTGGSITASYTETIATYVKVGKIVTVTFFINIASVSSQGSSLTRITGLPFAAIDAPYGVGSLSYANALDQSGGTIRGFHAWGSVFYFVDLDSASNASVDWEAGVIHGTITYETS